MNLDDIPAGSLCVIDTNVLLYAEHGASLQAQRLLRRIERRDLLDVVKRLTLHRDKIKALTTLGLGFEPCTKADLMDKAFEIQERYGFLTNDSVILAIALRLDADALVSADTRFQVTKDIRVYAPSDLRLPS
jgi:predicted nucleic acid-binding protein